MKKLEFETTINAPREKVWGLLWDDASYREWTAIFSEGSRAITDWQTGSKVLFVNADNDGMISMIAQNTPNEYMSIKHLGMVQNGVEDLEDAKGKEWYGAMENYTLTDVNGHTHLKVDIDITEEHEDYFRESWPQAMAKIKEMAERG